MVKHEDPGVKSRNYKNSIIYLDNNASTQLDDSVKKKMMEVMELFGNPSSAHVLGLENRDLIENARDQVASLVSCNSDEVYFTSGATESLNWAIKGAHQLCSREEKFCILTTTTEHVAVKTICSYLQTSYDTKTLHCNVDEDGFIDEEHFQKLLRENTVHMVSLSHANAELGCVQSILKLAKMTQEKSQNVLVHIDASQTIGKEPLKFDHGYFDFMTFTGHKFHGPKGVGCLIIKRGVDLGTLIHGGGHERGRRGGTENVMCIAGLGEACHTAKEWLNNFALGKMNHFVNRHLVKRLKTNLLNNWDKLNNEIAEIANLPDLIRFNRKGLLIESINFLPHPEDEDEPLNDSNILPCCEHYLFNTTSVSFRGIKSKDLVHRLRFRVALSAGSACHSKESVLSDTLQACGVDDTWGFGTVRISISRFTSPEELICAAEYIINDVIELWNELDGSKRQMLIQEIKKSKT